MRTLTATLCLTITLFMVSACEESADVQKGLNAYESGDYATALQEFKPLAEQGDATAQYYLGRMYEYDDGVQYNDNNKTAVKWYTLAAEQGNAYALYAVTSLAEQGNARAQLNLGLIYFQGQGVPSNYKTAMKWYTLAAEQGFADSQFNLGRMYDYGQGVSQDYKTALNWHSLAAEQGYALAQFTLGLMYHKGEGVPQNYETAVKWYRLAAEQGYADAQFTLGLMYAEGRGVPEDDKTAMKWYTLAAEQGDADAQSNLTYRAEEGDADALYAVTSLAEQGNADAQYALGEMYYDGKGVPQNHKTAVKWYSLAAEQGDVAAKQGLVEADFYLALYLMKEVDTQIPELFKKLDRRKIPSLHFIDGEYSNAFFWHFFGGSLFQWRSGGIDDRNLLIVTAEGVDKDTNLYAVVFGQPELTRWHIIQKDNNINSYLLGYRWAHVNVGHYNSKRKPVPCDSFKIDGMLTKVYEPKFFDLNGDGLPELLLRYNLAVADGYIQKLRVYKSSNGKDFCERKLIKEFSARNGFILHSEKLFKIGTQKRGSETESWLGASTHQVKELHYDGETEKVLNIGTVKNVLWETDSKFWE